MRRIALLLAIVGMLAGCGSSAPPAAAPSRSTTTARPSIAAPATTSPTSSQATVAPTTVAPTTPPPVAQPWTITCEDDLFEEHVFTSLKEAWKSDAVEIYTGDECWVEMDPAYTPTKTELAAEAAYIKADAYYGDEEDEHGALLDLIAACAAKDADVESLEDERDMLPFVLKVCPKAPHAAEMRAVIAGDVFTDGRYEVGVEIKAGTYRTEGQARDCYWERTTRGGDTIANDFVTLAPGGVTVRIRSTDGGFVSEGCGTWRRVK